MRRVHDPRARRRRSASPPPSRRSPRRRPTGSSASPATTGSLDAGRLAGRAGARPSPTTRSRASHDAARSPPALAGFAGTLVVFALGAGARRRRRAARAARRMSGAARTRVRRARRATRRARSTGSTPRAKLLGLAGLTLVAVDDAARAWPVLRRLRARCSPRSRSPPGSRRAVDLAAAPASCSRSSLLAAASLPFVRTTAAPRSPSAR